MSKCHFKKSTVAIPPLPHPKKCCSSGVLQFISECYEYDQLTITGSTKFQKYLDSAKVDQNLDEETKPR